MRCFTTFLATIFFVNSLFAFPNDKNFKKENYFLKKGYVSRNTYTHFDDRGLKDEFQDEVYFDAHEIARNSAFTKIADIGCGSGYKLLKYFGDYDTTGFEINPTFRFLKKTYPHKKWCLSNFDKLPAELSFDLIISADVIEHLVNPDELLNWLNQFDFKTLVISTPDRDALAELWKNDAWGSQNDSGPPNNIAHVREWGFDELEEYISQYFDIIDHYHPQREFYVQIIIAKKKL